MSDILGQVGNTPMVRLEAINTNNNISIYCKLEGNNPGGSVKDRAAYGMIKGAIERGELQSGMSSGGAVYAALELASGLESGVMVCIVCDRGDRYLSSDLFD